MNIYTSKFYVTMIEVPTYKNHNPNTTFMVIHPSFRCAILLSSLSGKTWDATAFSILAFNFAIFIAWFRCSITISNCDINKLYLTSPMQELSLVEGVLELDIEWVEYVLNEEPCYPFTPSICQNFIKAIYASILCLNALWSALEYWWTWARTSSHVSYTPGTRQTKTTYVSPFRWSIG